MTTAVLPHALQIPLAGVLLTLPAWLLLDQLARRCSTGSLGGPHPVEQAGASMPFPTRLLISAPDGADRP